MEIEKVMIVNYSEEKIIWWLFIFSLKCFCHQTNCKDLLDKYRLKIKQGGHKFWNSWKSWKNPGLFFDLQKSLKSIQISQLSRKLSVISGTFRILLQLKCLCIYKVMAQWLSHWIPNLEFPCSNPPGGSNIDSAFLFPRSIK